MWSADTGFTSGRVFTSSSVTGTTDPALYLDGRFDDAPAARVQYNFAVPNGTYDIRLYFSDGYGPGGRRFNVAIENTVVFPGLDVSAEAGGANTALIKATTEQVSDGLLTLEFLRGQGAGDTNPIISAIEIVASDAPSTPALLTASVVSGTQVNLSWAASHDDIGVAYYQVERCQGATCTNFMQIATTGSTSYVDSGLTQLTAYRYRIRAIDGDGHASSYSLITAANTFSSAPFTTIRVNAGGAAYTDSAQHVWSADTGFTSGRVFLLNSSVTGTSDPALYLDGRFDDSSAAKVQYNFAVPNGTYDVRLHFSDSYAPGGRIFKVAVEGTVTFPSVDVSAEAGGANIALIKTTMAQVNDQLLTLEFLRGQGAGDTNPIVNAIEVLQLSEVDTRAPSIPSGFAVNPVSSSRIDLAWTAATDNIGVTGYRLERCRGAGCVDFAEFASPAGTSFSDTGLSSGTVYRYRIRSVDAAGNFSAYSPVPTATTFGGGGGTQIPSAPSSLSASSYSAHRIDLSWTPATDDTGIVSYLLERCYGTGCTSFTPLTRVVAISSYNDVTVVGGVTYRYRLRALDADGNDGPYSPVASATTPLATGTAGSTTYQYDSFGRLKQVTVVPN